MIRAVKKVTANPVLDIVRLIEVIDFAAARHRNQRRKNREASPYINHPIALARVLAVEAGITDTDVLRAAILHDTIEDTETTHAELVEQFGQFIADVVSEVSDDKTLTWADRKRAQVDHAHALSPAARLVKVADKICNLRDVAHDPPHEWFLSRRRDYFDWAKEVVDAIGDTPPALQKLFDEVFAQRP